jgi:hypothetical protein
MTCRPGHAPRHPDFENGNTAAEKHGAHSVRRFRPLADQLKAEVIAEAPWLSRPAFKWAVEAWAVAEAKARIVDDWLNDHDIMEPEAAPANALSDRLHARAGALRPRLGLDAEALSKLLATFAGVPGAEDALDALKAEGRRLIEARSVIPQSGLTVTKGEPA